MINGVHFYSALSTPPLAQSALPSLKFIFLKAYQVSTLRQRQHSLNLSFKIILTSLNHQDLPSLWTAESRVFFQPSIYPFSEALIHPLIVQTGS